tara:strand:+ start:149 stop:325 length:177 start_codon:yes stop_codon:yes gene_type:complete
MLKSKTKSTPEEIRSMRDVLSFIPISMEKEANKNDKKRDIEEIFQKGKKNLKKNNKKK